MIGYSQEEMKRQLISDQHLWKRLPGALAAILWPLEAILLGWDTARWGGLVTVAIAVVLSSIAPRRLTINLYLLDLADRLLRLPLWLGWLLLVWQLATREPLYPILGVPVAGAILVTLLTWLVARVAILALGFGVRRTVTGSETTGA